MAALATASADSFSAQANLALTQGRSIAPPPSSKDPAVTRQAAEKFVGLFMSQMFNQMSEGVQTDSLFGGGPGENMFKSVLVDEYGKAAARNGGMGLTDQIMRTLIRQQEKQS
jgi:flagellar protein FlgJ